MHWWIPNDRVEKIKTDLTGGRGGLVPVKDILAVLVQAPERYSAPWPTAVLTNSDRGETMMTENNDGGAKHRWYLYPCVQGGWTLAEAPPWPTD